MIDIKVSGGSIMDDMSKQSDAVGKAARKALTRVGLLARDALVDEMRRVFDRPTPYTLAGIYVRGASSADPMFFDGKGVRDATVAVGLKDAFFSSAGVPAEKYLDVQITGGQRRMKSSEKLLAAAGILPDGMRAVPSIGARLDAYGNMESGQIQAILSYFRVHTAAGYQMNRTNAKRRGVYRQHDWIAIPPGEKLSPGIYLSRSNYGSARRGASLTPVLLFVPSPTYKSRFDFFGVANRVIERSIASEFEAALRMGSGYSPKTGASASV